MRFFDSLNFFKGTYVMEGSAKVLVIAVGIYSQTGIIITLSGATDKGNKNMTKINIKNGK